MILEKIENHSRIADHPAIRKAFDFLRELNAETENKRHYLEGDGLFVIVKSCEANPGDGTVLENHRRHIDVHFNISGEEVFEWSPVAKLEQKGDYLEQADATLYVRPPAGVMRFALPPGHFVAFFPDDGHGAELTAGGARTPLKKAILKIRMDLLGPSESATAAVQK